MKYIRTKDGIYEPDGESFDKSYFLVKAKGGWNYLSKKEPILEEADTIEELCDEFVCENSLIDSSPRKENGQIIDRYSKLDNAIMLAKKDLIVYGSIWVDGNLIKVAQINKKGELELL